MTEKIVQEKLEFVTPSVETPVEQVSVSEKPSSLSTPISEVVEQPNVVKEKIDSDSKEENSTGGVTILGSGSVKYSNEWLRTHSEKEQGKSPEQ